MLRRPPNSTPFPYTTLSHSAPDKPRQAVVEQFLLQPRLLEPHRAGGGRLEVAHALHVAHEIARRTAVGAEREHEKARAVPPHEAPEQERDLPARRAREGRAGPSAAAGILDELAGVRERKDHGARATVAGGHLPVDGRRAAGHRR